MYEVCPACGHMVAAPSEVANLQSRVEAPGMRGAKGLDRPVCSVGVPLVTGLLSYLTCMLLADIVL